MAFGDRRNKKPFNNRGNKKRPQKVLFTRRARACPLSGSEAPKVEYKDHKLLMKFLTERGKIAPSRITGVCAKMQRKLAKAIKRSREIGLISSAN